MNEFDLLARVLSPVYLAKSQLVMSEVAALKSRDVKIRPGKVKQYSVYRFDAAVNDFLPFFNNDHHTPNLAKRAPRGLREFCDYMILAVHNLSLHIFLVELKSGGVSGASSQLEAAELFTRYICDSAVRISQRNGVNFSKGSIHIRKVIVRNGARPLTNVGNCQPDWNQPVWVLPWD
jgi:hypothetical protein